MRELRPFGNKLVEALGCMFAVLAAVGVIAAGIVRYLRGNQ